MSNYILDQVRELLTRSLSANEISHRLHIDIVYVQQAIDFLKS
jgi:hypothetical protein